ncbi:uncharacterized protein LOC111885437 [Lactuca sativa]|uniref:uncharacterized protein LOC111885437 n=1 Tax=Lactuca sativa TaxID=4236 RepID=UPI000CB85DC9|nr:uncharacterized protein LOC111885437 [Lactuca sativa]
MSLSSLLHYAWSVILLGEHNYGGLNASNNDSKEKQKTSSGFQMPLHYPRYQKVDYEKMEEWRLDLLLQQYGLLFDGLSLEEKRCYAMGTFLWPCQL